MSMFNALNRLRNLMLFLASANESLEQAVQAQAAETMIIALNVHTITGSQIK